MAKGTVKAKIGDSLCNIAYLNGFGDCQPLREEPANAYIVNRASNPGQVRAGDIVTIPDFVEHNETGATEQTHNFEKRGDLAILRFVHGSSTTTVAGDRTLTFLNVSNYITDQAGTGDGNAPFSNSSVRNFNADADKDADVFKVEVLDINASGELDVKLEVLKPKYNNKGKVSGYERFPAAIRAARLLTAKASRQGSTKRFRTCYLRLVVDPIDKAAAADQTLLASDMYDPNDATTKQVEILDQRVKASYTINSCPMNPKCKSTVILPIGNDRRRIRLAVHVLRATPGGAPVVPLTDIERRVFMWFRRVYAQANIAPKLTLLREIDPPANLVAISDDHGANADGTERFVFIISAPGKLPQVIGPITPTAGDTPETTANRLAALVAAPYRASVSRNSARLDAASDNLRSADIVITETTGARVTVLRGPTSINSAQTLTVGRVNPAVVPRAPFNFSGMIGTIEQRTLFKNFDTGDDRVDVFVCQQINPNVRGTATISGHRVNANRAAVTKVKCSVLMIPSTIDATDNNPFTFPHEFGHVAGETLHAQAAPAQLMTSGTTGTNQLAGTKRIRDDVVTYDFVPANININLVRRIRAESAGLLENW